MFVLWAGRAHGLKGDKHEVFVEHHHNTICFLTNLRPAYFASAFSCGLKYVARPKPESAHLSPIEGDLPMKIHDSVALMNRTLTIPETFLGVGYTKGRAGL